MQFEKMLNAYLKKTASFELCKRKKKLLIVFAFLSTTSFQKTFC